LKEDHENRTENVNVIQIVGMDEMDEMEQRSVVLSLRLNDFSKKAIHHELVAVLQENAISYSNVRRFYSAGRLFRA
jgi:transposase